MVYCNSQPQKATGCSQHVPNPANRNDNKQNKQGGKQAGGYLYGSNDALCSAVSDRHAYSKTCGLGKWGDGAVVTVFLDMDARRVWFALNGSEPRPGFSGLPARAFPTVSVRAPAALRAKAKEAAASGRASGGGPALMGAPQALGAGGVPTSFMVGGLEVGGSSMGRTTGAGRLRCARVRPGVARPGG